LPRAELGICKSKRLRKDEEDWIKREYTEAERRNDIRALNSIVKEITNDRRNISVPIKSKCGKMLLTEEEHNNKRKEHFQRNTEPARTNTTSEPQLR